MVLGQKFVMLELKTVLYGLLHKFKMTTYTTKINLQIDLILRTEGDIKVNFLPLQ